MSEDVFCFLEFFQVFSEDFFTAKIPANSANGFSVEVMISHTGSIKCIRFRSCIMYTGADLADNFIGLKDVGERDHEYKKRLPVTTAFR